MAKKQVKLYGASAVTLELLVRGVCSLCLWITFGLFLALFIVVIQYHDRKHVFHIVPQHMLALGFDWGSGETFSQEKNFTGCRWDSNPGPSG